jgi:hypothetical protein
VIHGAGGAGLVERRGYLGINECSRVVDLWFQSGERAGGAGSESAYTPSKVEGGRVGHGT